MDKSKRHLAWWVVGALAVAAVCLLYTSDAADDEVQV